MNLREWIRIDAVEYAERCRQAHLEDCRRRVEEDARAHLKEQ